MDFGNKIYLRPVKRSTASPERESWEQAGDRMDTPKPASEMLGMMLLITISSGIWCAVGFVLGLAF